MRFTQAACAAALSAVVYANPSPAGNGGNNAGTGTTLSANAIQSGSFVDGSQEVGAAEVGQAKSLTSQNNFINNCAGKTLTNGLQITTGSCNGITMGDIPAKTKMVSSVITFPTTGGKPIDSDTTFNISVQTSNLAAGTFTNADATYYAAPQALQGGIIVGHTHVTVQDMGNSLNPTQALDPTQFAFFKGINDAGNGKGLLSAVVNGGLPAGNYRVCTMAAAANHQPVLMPVAQRGTPDDCTKFTVAGNGKTANVASNNGSGGQAAAALAASAVAAGPGKAQSTDASAAAASTDNAGKGGKAGGAKAVAASAKASSTAAAGANKGKGAGAAKAAGAGAASASGAAAGKGAGAGKAAGAGAGAGRGAGAGKGAGAGRAKAAGAKARRQERTFIA